MVASWKISDQNQGVRERTGPMPVPGFRTEIACVRRKRQAQPQRPACKTQAHRCRRRERHGIPPSTLFSPIRTVTVGSGLSPDLLDPAKQRQALAGSSSKWTYRR